MRRHITIRLIFLALGLLASNNTAFARPIMLERAAVGDSDYPPGTAGPYNPANPKL
jgi:hypothetical protein